VPAFDSGAARDIKLRFAYGSPNSGSVVPTVGSALPPITTLATGSDQTLSLAFTGGIATTNFRYQDAGSLTITASYTGSAGTGDAGLTMGTVLGNASYLNPFVVAPQNLVLSGIPAAPLTAGSPFNVTVTAMNNCSPAATTQNFAGTVLLSSSNPQPGIGNATAISQNITVSSGGTASANTTWNEVGTIDLTATTSSYLGSGLNVTSSATTAGRFQPAYFETFVTPGCAGSFTYTGLTGPPAVAGQPFTVQVKAKRFGGDATDGTNTANYAGATWAKTVTLSDVNAGSGTFGNGSFAATDFVSGKASNTGVYYAIASQATAPSTLIIRAIDDDSPAVSSSGHAEGSTVMRSGRLRLANANGSELLSLPLTARAEYFQSTSLGWQPSSGDTCTTLAASDFAFNFPSSASPANNLYSATAGVCKTAIAISGTPPIPTVTLSAPGIGNNGWADLTLNLGATASGNQCAATCTTSCAAIAATTSAKPWLQYDWKGAGVANPTARATFGVFRSGPVIHRRENY
jgi:MSHA biogenesis protein MshQ